jgi:hypothetical protein
MKNIRDIPNIGMGSIDPDTRFIDSGVGDGGSAIKSFNDWPPTIIKGPGP